MKSPTLPSIIGILRDAFKIFSKNGSLMASIALVILFTKSIIDISSIFSIKATLSDFTIEKNLLPFVTPNATKFTNSLTHIRNDIKFIVGVQIILYIILNFVAFLLLATATIHATAMAIIHGGKKDELSLKETLLRTAKSWKRPLITWLYIFLIGIVYIIIFFAILFLLVQLSKDNPVSSAIAVILLLVFTLFFYIYLSVKWTLATVVSVVDQIRGLEALGKAAKIVKGMKRQVFVLYLVIRIFRAILVRGIELISLVKSPAVATVEALLIEYIGMYWFVAFTVFYFRCKKTHRETVELQGICSHYGYCIP